MDLIKKIENKKTKIAIIGLGYVGLPLALEFVSKGFDVVGFNVDNKKTSMLNVGKSYMKHISEDRIKLARGLIGGKSSKRQKLNHSVTKRFIPASD